MRYAPVLAILALPACLGFPRADTCVDCVAPPGLVIDAQPTLFTSENGESASFWIALQSVPKTDVVVPVVSSIPSEALVVTPPLVFTADTWDMPQTVIVQGVDDSVAIADGDIAYVIDVGPLLSEDTSYAGLTAHLSGVNTDDDVAAFVMSSTTAREVFENDAASTVTTVSLATKPVGVVTALLNADRSTRASVSPTTLSFDDSNWNVPVQVTLTPTDDQARNYDAVFEVTFGPASGDSAYAGKSTTAVEVTIRDDERQILKLGTSVAGDLNIGSDYGLPAVDAACSTNGGSYKALLAAANRLPNTSGWVLKPGYNYVRGGSTIVIGRANDRGELPDPLQNTILGPPDVYWTGILVSSEGWSAGQTCSNWSTTYTYSYGQQGAGNQLAIGGALAGPYNNCDQSQYVLCVEQ